MKKAIGITCICKVQAQSIYGDREAMEKFADACSLSYSCRASFSQRKSLVQASGINGNWPFLLTYYSTNARAQRVKQYHKTAGQLTAIRLTSREDGNREKDDSSKQILPVVKQIVSVAVQRNRYPHVIFNGRLTLSYIAYHWGSCHRLLLQAPPPVHLLLIKQLLLPKTAYVHA